MTAQERAELSELRKEVQEGFREVRGLHMDMIQRIARLEAAAQTTQSTTQYKLMQAGIIISLVSAAYTIIH